MLKHVATGIAMGNAEPHVKAVADSVTTSVDEDGIANEMCIRDSRSGLHF